MEVRRPTRSDRPGRPGPLVGLLSIVLAGAVVGAAAMVLTAVATARLPVLVGAGVLAAAATAAGLVALVRRHRPRSWPRWLVAAGAAGAAMVLAAGTLIPLADPPADPDPADLRYWQLSTGSRLAYLSVPATSPHRQPWPVVVLHGGPGVPDLAHDRAFWGRLATDGFDVYVYAQLGAGSSGRLTDPTGYSRERDVADLEQIRRRLGAERLVLVGHSYGGTLAAAYLAAHPDHVARLVLSSPGPLDPDDHSGDRATARLTVAQRMQLYPALQPRALLAYLLLQVDPAAAYAYLPDPEADARNDRLLNLASPGLTCTGPPATRISGSGFYRLQYPQSAGAPAPPDLRTRLVGRRTPALVLKGGCDYQSWTSASDYRDVLGATLVYLPQVGHSTYGEDPDTVLAEVRAFLARRPLPVPPYRGPDPPVDYQHP